ncbi:MAG: JAB domain-containing protein, partial [Oscillospiraceae bacterium]|nr:JAB domain-containing protein [Oscillospiraceae bacterium]
MTENETKRYKLKEVCIRLAEGHPLYSDVPLSSPTAALDVMRKELSQYDREILCVVNLNNKLKPINFNIVSMGSINGSIASIPNILKSGILSNAHGFLLLHNHPSGDVTPSREDIQTTRRCIEAGKIMDIPCLDHVIVGGGNSDYYSFRESGMVDFTNEKISMTAEQILRVNESNSSYKGGNETMPENGSKDDQFVPDFVKEAEE